MNELIKCVLLRNDYELLILQRSDEDEHGGMWETVCGGIDEGETPTEACLREIKEETGMDVENIQVKNSMVLVDDDTGVKYMVHLFIANVSIDSQVNIEDNPDHQDFEWVDFNQLLQYKVESWTLKTMLYMAAY